MRQRLFTTIIYLSIFIPLLMLGGVIFDLFAVFLALVIFSELMVMKGIPIKSFGAIIGYISTVAYILADRLIYVLPWFSQANVLIVTLMVLLIYMLFSKLDIEIDEITVLMFGLFYIGNAFSTLVYLRDLDFFSIFYLMIIIWVTDSGAFLVGRRLGKKPLAPSISPNKTVEGAVGGVILSVIASVLFRAIFPVPQSIYPNVLIVVIMSIAAQMGDLVESAMKRYYNIKDSGDILPGHGGLFDRFDSLIFLMNLIKLLMDFGIFAY